VPLANRVLRDLNLLLDGCSYSSRDSQQKYFQSDISYNRMIRKINFELARRFIGRQVPFFSEILLAKL